MEMVREEQLFQSPPKAGAKGTPPHSLERRGATPSPERVYDAQRLWDKHQQMKRLIFLGWTNKQIAAALDCSAATVCNIRNSSMMKRELALMHAAADGDTLDVGKELARLAPKAVEVLQDILEDDEAPIVIKMRTASTVLDRTGHGPITKVAGQFQHTHFTAEDIEQIKRDALAAGRANGDIIDVQVGEGDPSRHTNGGNGDYAVVEGEL